MDLASSLGAVALATATVTGSPTVAGGASPSIFFGFVENQGQGPDGALFSGNVGAYGVRFLHSGIDFLLPQPEPARDFQVPDHVAYGRRPRTSGSMHEVTLAFEGAQEHARVSGADQLEGPAHYFVGPREKWRSHVPRYARVRYDNLYPGIDAVFSDAGGTLKYDFVVASAASPAEIRMRFRGVEALTVDEAGDLVLRVSGGEIRLRRPFAYQEHGAGRQPIAAAFSILDKQTAAFIVGHYDRRRALVIDPTIGWASYLGGNRDDNGYFHGIAVDGEGALYVTGRTNSLTGTLNGRTSQVAFVAKIAPWLPSTEQIRYITYVSGSTAYDIFVDSAKRVYIAGTTGSKAYYAKLTAAGGLDQLRTFGLANSDATGIAADDEGNIFVVGGGNLPASPSPVFPPQVAITGGGFVARFDQGGNLTHVGRIGWFCYDLAIDGQRNLYVGGHAQPSGAFRTDAFAAKINPDFQSLAYYTTVSAAGSNDPGYGIAIDSQANAYVSGQTSPSDDSVTFNAFLAKVGADGQLVWRTEFGGSDWDEAYSVAADNQGQVYTVGATLSADFAYADPYTSSTGCCGFAAKFDAGTGAAVWSTPINATNSMTPFGVALAPAKVYVQGRTPQSSALIGPSSGGFQPTHGGGSSDLFIVQIRDGLLVEILPSTARWKPQRDTTKNVNVLVDGPEDLDLATFKLSVTPPAGDRKSVV